MDPRAQVRAFISATFFVDEFEDGDSFLQAGILDSSGMMELVAFLERTFAFQIRDDELLPENLDSLDNISRFIHRKLTQAA